MRRVRFYFFIGFLILVGGNTLLSMPRYLFSGSMVSPASALDEINLKDVAAIKKSISQGYNSGGLFAVVTYVGGRHNGIDISAKYGAPIYSPVSGEVVVIGNQDNFCFRKNYGKFIAIKNNRDGKTLLFAHLSKIKVDEGDGVGEGEIVAENGSSGKATAPHLHITIFEKRTFQMIKKNGCDMNPTGKDVNPIRYLESL